MGFRLKPSLLDADMVVSLAWCPSPGEELLVAGLSGGYLVLWELWLWLVILQIFASRACAVLGFMLCPFFCEKMLCMWNFGAAPVVTDLRI